MWLGITARGSLFGIYGGFVFRFVLAEPSQAQGGDKDYGKYETFPLKRGLLHRSHVKSLHWDVAGFHLEFFIKDSRKSKSGCPMNTFRWFLVSDP